MDRLLDTLHQFCQKYGRVEKTLVVPSRFIGWQIANRYAEKFGGVINLRYTTIAALAEELPANQNVRFATPFHTLVYTAKACREAIPGDGYFGELKNRRGFHHAMARTLGDLSAAGAMRLLQTQSNGNAKLSELSGVVQSYQSSLQTSGLHSAEEKISLALRWLRENSSSIIKRPIAILGEMTFTLTEMEILRRLADGVVCILPPDSMEENLRRLQFSMFRAFGEENEIRHIFRKLINEQISYDNVELLYTETSTYLPLIYQLTQEYDVPATFASGIPLTATHTGQAAMGFLAWFSSDFSAADLYNLLHMNCIRLPETPDIGAATVANAIRNARIGTGMQRYLRQISNWELMLATPRESTDEDGETKSHEFQKRRLQATLTGVRELVSLVPPRKNGMHNLADVANSLQQFLSRFTKSISVPDRQASEVLERLLEQIAVLPELLFPANEAVAELTETITGLHWGASLPKPGMLHVSHFRSGGYSGRVNTFLVGMDEGRYPGGSALDPILLDSERQKINEAKPPVALSIGASSRDVTEREFDNCLARIQGNLTISYSGFDLLDHREKYPSTKLLSVCRIARDNPTVGYDFLEQKFGELVGFLDTTSLSAGASEHYLREAIISGENFRAPIFECHPMLQTGEYASQSRLSDKFTEYDGWVRSSEESLDPRITGKPVSATRLSQLSKCAYMYFLQHVLQIEPAEELIQEPLQWLDPLEYGSVLHTVFHRIMMEITSRNEMPSKKLHEVFANEIIVEELDAEIKRNPPAVEISVDDVRARLQHACLLFLQSEENRWEKYEPAFFELPFGIPNRTTPDGINSSEPIPLLLANQQKVLLRGIIDRVNHVRGEANKYEIVDYKSGSDFSFDPKSAFNQGRQIQHGLYGLALEELLRQSGTPGQVVQTGYFFPSKKTAGKWLTFPMNDANRENLYVTVALLCDILGSSSFLRTKNVHDCKYCHYRAICGDVESLCKASETKLEQNTAPLEAMVKLQNDE